MGPASRSPAPVQVAAMNVNTDNKAEPIADSKGDPVGCSFEKHFNGKSDVAQWTARTADANTKIAMSWI